MGNNLFSFDIDHRRIIRFAACSILGSLVGAFVGVFLGGGLASLLSLITPVSDGAVNWSIQMGVAVTPAIFASLMVWGSAKWIGMKIKLREIFPFAFLLCLLGFCLFVLFPSRDGNAALFYAQVLVLLPTIGLGVGQFVTQKVK